MEQEKSWRDRIDYTLLFLVFVLGCLSIMAIYAGTTTQFFSAEDYEKYRHVFALSQAKWFLIGFVLMVVVMLVDYEYLKRLTIPIFAFGMILLLWVQFFGVENKGATRWIGINGTPIYQPSEVMKIILVLTLAHLIVVLNQRYSEKGLKADLKKLGWLAAFGIPPFYLVLKQPDLGSALVLAVIIATAILMANVSYKVLASLAALAGAGIAFLYYLLLNHIELITKYVLEEHQLVRILGWLYPEEYASGYAMQTLNATRGIGSGQLTGSGFLNSVQAANASTPELHTDFIFAVIGEEFGFLGSTVVICVYFLLIYRLIMLAHSCNDLYGTSIIAGIAGMLTFQIFQNIAMTIGLMPVTGIALPFLSYGGSALMTNMVAIGIVLNIGMRQKTYMFKSTSEVVDSDKGTLIPMKGKRFKLPL